MAATRLRKAQIAQVSNRSGHVLVNYTNCTVALTNNTIAYYLPIAGATPTISPLTSWPVGSSKTYTDMYYHDPATDVYTYKLRENNVVGQIHRWRVQLEAHNSTKTNTIGCFIINDETAYRLYCYSYIPAGAITNQTMTFEFTSIADSKSLAAGKGYRIGVFCSTVDTNLTIELKSILRISEAIELEVC